MIKSKTRKKSLKSKRTILILSVLALLLITGLAGYVYSSSDRTFFASTQDKPGIQPPPSPSAPIEATPTPIEQTRTINIPELGIQIENVPEELNDMFYAFNPGQNGIKWVSFSSSSLNELCPDYSIGGLTRGEDMYNYNPHIPLTKQFDNFWVSFAHVQVGCETPDRQVPDLLYGKVDAINKLLNSPENIQALKQ